MTYKINVILCLSVTQGLMFGYATDETEELMPLTIMLSHRLNSKIADLRRSGELSWARPDTKTQVGRFFCDEEVIIFTMILIGLSKIHFLLPAETNAAWYLPTSQSTIASTYFVNTV